MLYGTSPFTNLTYAEKEEALKEVTQQVIRVFTHLSWMEFPTIINWASPFPSKGCWKVFFILIQILIENSVSKQWRF